MPSLRPVYVIVPLLGLAVLGVGGWVWKTRHAEAPKQESPAVVPAGPPAPPARHVIEVHVSRPAVWPGIRQADELAGLFTALVESGLGDLIDVAPMVDGVPPSPGLGDRLHTAEEVWTGKLALVADGDSIRYGLLLCDPQGLCADLDATGSRDAPAAAVATLLARSADVLGRPGLAEAAATWANPQSTDPYAVLVCGRGAAVFYGIRPPVAESLRGDDRRDPIARAVYIDPAMPVGWWVQGRSLYGWGEIGKAREAFTRATIAKPSSVLMKADEAEMLGALGRWEAAWFAWDEVNTRSPDDPRFAVARAKAALQAEKVPEAIKALDGLDAAYQDERSVAELRVAIAERTGQSSNYDELLARWQTAAPNEPEPVRRRIALRVDDGDLEDALDLTQELGKRGQPEEAARLALGLAVGLGDFATAAQRADELGDPVTAARIRARADLEKNPKLVPASLETTDATGNVVAGEALLSGGDAAGALDRSKTALKERPWMPEALDLEARALDGLGREAEAEKARVKREQADPAWNARP